MSEVKLHLCIPNYGGQIFTAFEQCRAVCEREGLFHSMTYVSDSLVSRSRNTLTQRFLDSASTHLLFIDADIVFRPQHVKLLVEQLAKGKEIVGGLYPLKQKALTWVLNAIPGEEPDAEGMLKVKYIGTGFLAVARSVFFRMAAAFPEIQFETDANEGINQTNGGQIRTIHDFWSVGVFNRRYLSEDWFFCERAKQLNIPVWAHTKIQLGHMGLIQYPLEPVAESGKAA